MISADLDILASSYAKFDKGIPSISLTLVDKAVLCLSLALLFIYLFISFKKQETTFFMKEMKRD